MNDIFDYNETREILSVVIDQLHLNKMGIKSLNIEDYETIKSDIKSGKRLLKGQIVKMPSNPGGVDLGHMFGIVVGISPISENETAYSIIQLYGDLTVTPDAITVKSSDLDIMVDVNVSTADVDKVVNAVKTQRFGEKDILDIKKNIYGLYHLYAIDVDNPDRLRSFF